jgi:signal transduction histidine kinase
MDTEPLDLRDATRAAIDTLHPLLTKRDLDVRVSLGGRPLTVVGDVAQLERVATNLLTNAVKFTPDGGRITVHLGEHDGEAFLEVSDTGIGIPEDEQPELFDPFFRSSTAQELEVPGTGLGLPIVRTIVAAHGGRVSVHSRPGEGTTVRVAVPLPQRAASEAAVDAGQAMSRRTDSQIPSAAKPTA